LVILYFTLIPAKYLVDSPWYNQDKLGHLAVFFGWTFLFLVQQSSRSSPLSPLLIMFISLVFGLGIELLQYILPLNRSAELSDFLADAIGSGISFPVFRWLHRQGLL
jgi:VanZ family protein